MATPPSSTAGIQRGELALEVDHAPQAILRRPRHRALHEVLHRVGDRAVQVAQTRRVLGEHRVGMTPASSPTNGGEPVSRW